MSYLDERQSDLIQKANYYNEQKKYEYNKYETTDRDKIKVMNLTERQLDHIIYKASYSANNQLLSVIMQRFNSLSKQVDQLQRKLESKQFDD